MNKLTKTLRLKRFLAARTFGYSLDYIERVFKIYLNHSKIIHFRDGYPVYSLSTPALYSKPSANFFARMMFKSIQNRNMPNMMSYAVNDICNAACKHCSFFTGVDDKGKKVLTLEESKKLIHDAQELGVSLINFVGGEPTLRQDITEILKSVDKDLSATVMFTNGSMLEKRAQELKDAGLDSVYISIDYASAEKHDRFRGKKGLFETAMKGIQEAKRVGLSTGISCCITPESYKDGEFDRIIELGKKIGIHEVVIFDAMPTGRFKFRKDLIDNNAWVEEMIEKSKPYNVDDSYPGVLIWAYATSHRSVGCSCGTSYLYVSPYGDIMSCDFNHAIFGSIKDEPLYRLWDNMTSQAEFCKSKWGGCKIKDSTFRKSPNVSPGKGCSC